MTFREFNKAWLEPGAQWLMIIGIISLCQPWIAFLHSYSVTMMLVGLITFNVALHVPPPERKPPTGPTSVSDAVEESARG